MNAIYVSVFDDCHAFESPCQFNPITRTADNIQLADEGCEEFDALTDEYVIYRGVEYRDQVRFVY